MKVNKLEEILNLLALIGALGLVVIPLMCS